MAKAVWLKGKKHVYGLKLQKDEVLSLIHILYCCGITGTPPWDAHEDNAGLWATTRIRQAVHEFQKNAVLCYDLSKPPGNIVWPKADHKNINAFAGCLKDSPND